MESEDECFVVMEYASGGELIDYIVAKGNLSEKEARRFFRQMISALDHCHLANVVHRDLKLENLLLNNERNLLISDFGLGRTFDSETEDFMKTFCGTPNYAAVELISGIPYLGVKSDIWAMGVVLYIMMTGKPPFFGESISALYSKIKAVEYKCPTHFSHELRQLLSKLLVRDPKLRADMDIIRQDPWVNFEEIELPFRITPKIVGNVEPSQIGQFISSIHHDQEFIIYTFQSNLMDADRIANLKKQALKKKSKTNADTPRISADEPTHFRASTIQVYTDFAQPRASITQKFSRRMSVQSSTRSTSISTTQNMSISTTNQGGNLTINSGTRAKRRNTVTSGTNDFLTPKITIDIIDSNSSVQLSDENVYSKSTVRNSYSKSLSPTSLTSTTTILGSTPSQRRGRQLVEDGIGLAQAANQKSNNRDFNVLRRMSQVGPSIESGLTIVNDSVKHSRRGSFNTAVSPLQSSFLPVGAVNQTISGSMLRCKRMISVSSSGPEDLDYMQDVDSTDEMKEMDESEITTKEIEAWHLLHKPPKQIRTVRFTFTSNTTSSAAPFLLFQEVHR
ncbi:Protein kinase, partial [Nowakowskiella sp. JEL0078]